MIRSHDTFNMYVFKKEYLILRVNWRWGSECSICLWWLYGVIWTYFGMWSWRLFWQLFIALNRAATILCNQGVVFWDSWTPAFFPQFLSWWLSKNMKNWDKTKGGWRWGVKIQGILPSTFLIPLRLIFILISFSPKSEDQTPVLVTFWKTS